MERGKFDPPAPHKPLNRWSPKFVWMTTSAISTTMQNFIQIGFREFRFCACVISRPSAQSDSATFLVLEKGYSQDACTDFDAKYVKRRGSAQGSAFWGSRNHHLRFRPPFSQKTAILGPISTGLRIFSPENGFNIGRFESKRPLIVVVA